MNSDSIDVVMETNVTTDSVNSNSAFCVITGTDASGVNAIIEMGDSSEC